MNLGDTVMTIFCYLRKQRYTVISSQFSSSSYRGAGGNGVVPRSMTRCIFLQECKRTENQCKYSVTVY